MDCSTSKCYSSDQDACPCPLGQLHYAITTNWAISPSPDFCVELIVSALRWINVRVMQGAEKCSWHTKLQARCLIQGLHRACPHQDQTARQHENIHTRHAREVLEPTTGNSSLPRKLPVCGTAFGVMLWRPWLSDWRCPGPRCGMDRYIVYSYGEVLSFPCHIDFLWL